MFTIVYPKKSVKGAIYPAITLQYKLWQAGAKIPLATESSADACEVVIRECEGMQKGSFCIATEGKKLIAEASDLYGFIAASDCLCRELFADGKTELPKVSRTGSYTGEMPDKKTASHRVMYHNVWSYDPNYRNFGTRGAAYEIAEVMTYRPDVVGFNEFVDEWRQKTDVIELLHAIGYREVTPPEIDRLMINPLFYNTETVRYVEGSCHMGFYGTLIEASPGRSLVNAERYYNDTPSRYRGGNAAVFEDLATGERFGVCVTHLEANCWSERMVPDDGDPLRAEEVGKLIPFLKQMSETYNVPFTVGGDYNSTADRIACKKLEEAGFRNAHNNAENADDLCSCHGYPLYCAELDNFVDYSCPGIEEGKYFGYDRGIDQIYMLGGINAKTYRVLHEKSILCSSDHCPVMLDFDLIESHGKA